MDDCYWQDAPLITACSAAEPLYGAFVQRALKIGGVNLVNLVNNASSI